MSDETTHDVAQTIVEAMDDYAVDLTFSAYLRPLAIQELLQLVQPTIMRSSRQGEATMVIYDEQQQFRAWANVRLPAPSFDLSSAKQQAFEQLLWEAERKSPDGEIDYTCAYPKYEFLRYVVEYKQLLLHGSRNHNIPLFQPVRKSSDTVAFGQQAAVYAASDGIWPIVFATLDRQVYHGIFYNECSRVQLDNRLTDPFYAFVIEAKALRRQPWTDGMIYLLPRASFVPRPPSVTDGLTVHCQEWASVTAVEPIAKLAVNQTDFPFLHDFWGFDEKVPLEHVDTYPEVWPFGDLNDTRLYPIRPKHGNVYVAGM